MRHVPKRLKAAFLAATLAFCGAAAADTSPPGDTPRPLDPVRLTIPRELWHVAHSWKTGEVLLRIGTDGRVEDWVPLDLPDHRLVPALDRALREAEFEPAFENGKPVVVDTPATLPLGGVGAYIIVSENLDEHIESRQAAVNPDRRRLIVSSADELDRPLELTSHGEAFVYEDASGRTLTGTVMVEFHIGPEGRPHLIRVPEETDPLKAEAARQTAAGLRFAPPTRDLRPTVVKVRLPVVLGSEL